MSEFDENNMGQEAGPVKAPKLTLDPDEKQYDIPFTEPSLGKTEGFDENTASAGTVDESMLSEDEKKQVEEFVKQIDVADIRMVNSYGAGAQRGIANFSTSITGTVKTKEFGDVGDSLRELRVAINSTMAPEKKGLLGLFQKGKQKATYLIAN